MSLTVNLCVVGKSSARPIVIDEKEQRVSVGPFLRYLEDARHQLKIKDVIDPHFEKKWLSNSSPALNFGFSESTYWLHLQLENVTSSTRERILALEYPPMDMMETYTFEASGSEQLLGRCGDTIPFKERPIKSRYCTVSLQIPPQSTLNVILKLHTEGSFQIPLMLYTPSAYYSHDHEQQLFFGALIAILAVMALYNFFIFLSLKEATYFYYVIYITGEILFYGCTNGIAYEYFWPSLSGWSRVSLPATLGLSVISGIPFTLSYLRTRDHVPRIDLALKAVMVLYAIQLLLAVSGFYVAAIRLGTVLALPFLILALTGSALCLRKGYRPAKFFIIAWSAFLVGGVVFALKTLGLLPPNPFTEYSMQIGGALEVVLLSLGMADRINIERAMKIEAQQQALAILKKNEKLKDEFLANTSHELRTPLNGIVGIAESFLDGTLGSISEVQRYNLQMIISSGRRLSSLVNDILDFSKLRDRKLNLHPKAVPLRDAVNLVCTVSNPLIKGKDLKIINKIPADGATVFADENRLQQILFNLIGNAIKFTEKGSVTISCSQQDQFMQIMVQDTGIGIPAEKLEDIFTPFEQLDGTATRSHGGTGLGLAVCRSLVELQGGKVWATSQLGRGSTFHVILPLGETTVSTPPESITSPETIIPVPAIPEDDTLSIMPQELTINFNSKIRILLVDDEPINLLVLKNHLSHFGCTLLQAHSGQETLNIIAEQGRPDLILLDVMMPRMSGLEVVAKIRERYSAAELPIILLTAKNQISDLVEGFSSGANDYVTKPFSKNELLARVRSHVQISEVTIALANAKGRLEKLLKSTQELAGLRETQDAVAQACFRIIDTITAGKRAPFVVHFYDSLDNSLDQSDCLNDLHLRITPSSGPKPFVAETVEASTYRAARAFLFTVGPRKVRLEFAEVEHHWSEEDTLFADSVLYSLSMSLENIRYVRQILTTQARIQARERDMEAAKLVQETLLPKYLVTENFEIADYYQAAERVGGDWYHYAFDPMTNRLYIAIADVVGHGIPSALVTGVLFGSIRSSLLQAGSEPPSQILVETASTLNKTVLTMGQEAKVQLSLYLCCIEVETGVIFHVNAGHPCVFMTKSEKTISVATRGSLIGFTDKPIFKTIETMLEQGDSLLFYTDGLFENSGPDGATLNRTRLRKLLRHGDSAESTKNLILSTARQVWKDEPPADDCTFVIVRWHNPKASLQKTPNLLAAV